MLKIVNSTGIGYRTDIVDADTGESICEKIAIEWGSQFSIEREGIVGHLRVVIEKAEVCLSSVEWIIMNPVTQLYEPISSIQFKNGSTVVFNDDGTFDIK